MDHESAAGPECPEIAIESGDPQRQDVEKSRRLPAHAGPFETTLDDMLARPLYRARAHGESSVPWFLVADPGPVPFHVADQLGECIMDSLLPWTHPFQRTEDLADAVHQQCSHVLLHPGLGPCGITGVLQVGEGIEMLAEMI